MLAAHLDPLAASVFGGLAIGSLLAMLIAVGAAIWLLRSKLRPLGELVRQAEAVMPTARRCGTTTPWASKAAAERTSADLPIPRAPHNSMSCEAWPRARRWIFSVANAFCRSIPCSASSGSGRNARAGSSTVPRQR